MKGFNVIGKVAVCGLGLVATGMVIGTIAGFAAEAICVTASAVHGSMKKISEERKIKKGLKDGSIVEIDGEYCEVIVSDPK